MYYLFQFQFVHIEVILLAIHIISIGTVVALTAYFSFSLGKKKGVNIYLNEEKDNIKKK